MGLFRRIGRTGATGSELSTPGEPVAVRGPAITAASGHLSGGVLSRDLGPLYRGPMPTSKPYSLTASSDVPAEGMAVRSRASTFLGPRSVRGRGLLPPGEQDPHNPAHPSRDPAGAASGRGRLSGGAMAAQAGAIFRADEERVSLLGQPWDPRFKDPRILERPSPTASGDYRPGKLWRAYWIRPRRDWGREPFFNGNHARIRAQFARTPVGRQVPQGGPYPEVYRPKPQAWDHGVLRGGPTS